MNNLLLPRLIRRSGSRLLLAFGSLLVGALTLTVVLGLIGSVERFFVAESKTLLGGDVSIEDDSKIVIPDPLLSLITDRGVTISSRIETIGVIQSELTSDAKGLESLLVSLKVVDSAYPLYGALGLTQTGTLSIPNSEEIFLAEDALVRMGVAIGDNISLGKAQFRIANVITSEPDSVGGSFRLGPLALLSYEGWARTGIDGEQSRIDHLLSLRYSEGMTASENKEMTTLIRASFEGPRYRVAFAEDGPTSLLRILDLSERFFFTMIVLALFLVVVNIRLNLTYFLAGFQKTIAIMRSLGMQRGQLLRLFLTLLLIMALVAGVLGGILGNILGNLALPLAERFIGSSLPLIPLFDNVATVSIFVFALCLFAGLGFLVRILAIEPKMLLLGYGSAHGKFQLLKKELPILFLTLLGLYGGVFYLTERPLVALVAVGSITAIFLLLFLLSRGAILLGYRTRFALPFSIRSIINFLKHQGVVGTTAIASLTIALASIFAITLLERNVLGNLSVQFKKDAPNIYLIDVQEDQLPGVRAIMGETWRDFAMVRARFAERDGYDIQANLATEDGELRREFNVTSATTFIEGERVVSGVWHGTTEKKAVSVEKGFADRAKLVLGSRVKFTVQGFPIEATVTSLREVESTSGLPFFFLVFSPDALEGIPRTSFGYAFAPTTTIPFLQNELARTYPNITSIPTTQIIETAAKIVSALSAAVVATTIPALVLGLILIFAMLAISVRERTNDMLVFTAYGARLSLLFTIFLVETSAVIVIAGIFATLLSHAGVYALNYYVFDFTGFYIAVENIYLFVGILLVTLGIAYAFARRFTQASPAELLRKEGV